MNRRAATHADLLRIKIVSDVQLSPDGTRIAYVLSEIDEARDAYRTSIWTVPVEGGEPEQLTRGDKQDSAPRWSPDGQWLAFLSNRNHDKAQLYVLPLNGGEARQLTTLESGAGAAVWQPAVPAGALDSQRILFAARVLKELPPADAEARKLWQERPKVVTRAQYKADGQGYTFDAVSQLFVVALDGGEPKQLTDGDNENRAPAWSPDGTQIAWSRTREGVGDYGVSDIWVMNADGSQMRRVSEQIGRATSPSWAPDGASLACYGTERQEHGLGDSVVHVWVLPLDGGAPRALTLHYDRGVTLLAPPAATPGAVWSGDRSSLTFTVADAGNMQLVRAALDGEQVQPLVAGERQLISTSLSQAHNRIAFIATDLTQPSDVFVCDWDGGNERRLMHVNQALLDELELPRIERRTFANPNGGTIDGWLARPAQSDGPLPLLVDIHGGPHSFFGNAFWLGYFYRYVLAAQGWAVIALNPTGSGSYGKAFAQNIRGRWGEHDLPEQLAAVDALIAEGVADGERLAVTGYSYGGFMTSWTIGQTDRYKAAVVGAPVVNQESFHGTSDIGHWFASWELNGDLFSNRETFRRLSPVNNAERVTTPTLILHGEGDDRCPIGQGEEFFIALIAAGKVPTQFVRYPGGSHLFIVNGRPSHRVDYSRRVAEWVVQHTLGS